MSQTGHTLACQRRMLNPHFGCNCGYADSNARLRDRFNQNGPWYSPSGITQYGWGVYHAAHGRITRKMYFSSEPEAIAVRNVLNEFSPEGGGRPYTVTAKEIAHAVCEVIHGSQELAQQHASFACSRCSRLVALLMEAGKRAAPQGETE